jgi:hypothetical protein
VRYIASKYGEQLISEQLLSDSVAIGNPIETSLHLKASLRPWWLASKKIRK